MIGFALNIVGGLFNVWLYKRYNNEVNSLCAKINFAFAFFFLILYLFSVSVLTV